MVVLTRDGYIKKTALRSYEASIQSSKGSDPFPKLKVSDKTVFCQKQLPMPILSSLQIKAYIIPFLVI